jgi:hypothetical protein
MHAQSLHDANMLPECLLTWNTLRPNTQQYILPIPKVANSGKLMNSVRFLLPRRPCNSTLTVLTFLRKCSTQDDSGVLRSDHTQIPSSGGKAAS